MAVLFADAGPMGLQAMASEMWQEEYAVSDGGNDAILAENNAGEEKGMGDYSFMQMGAEVQDDSAGEESDVGEQGNLSGEQDSTEDKGESVEEGDDSYDKDKPSESGSTGDELALPESMDQEHAGDGIHDGEPALDETENNEEVTEKEIMESEEDNEDTVEEVVSETEVVYSKETDIAYTVTGGNIYFNESCGTITDCDVSVTKAVIPSEINGIEVTSIGDSAFKGCSSLVSITIPECVTSIELYAFDGCTSLRELMIPEGVTYLGGYMVRNTSIERIKIPSTIKNSGYQGGYGEINGALAGCTYLKEVIFAEGIERIPSYICASESQTSYIEKIIIPDSIKEIGDYAFHYCRNLSGIINIPKTVKKVGEKAFYNCSSITKVIISYNDEPNWSASLEASAFAGCTSLRSVELSSSVKELRDYLFSGCTSLETLEIPEGVTYLGGYMVRNTSIERIKIPSTIKNSGYQGGYGEINGALAGCTYLKEVIFAEGIERIPSYICASESQKSCVSSVVIPNSIKEIDTYAFCNCNNLADIYYQGNEKEWAIISINSGNDSISNAIIHYKSFGPDKPAISDICFTDSPYSVYTDYDVCIMAKIENGRNLSDNDFTWTSNDENVAKIISTSGGQLGDVTYAFATVRGTGNTLGYGSLTLTLSDGRSARCAIICAGKKTNEKQSFYQVPTQPKDGEELLDYYGDQWEKEYDAYIEAVKDCLYKYAASDSGKKDAMIAAVANKLQEEDKKSSSKHLSFEATFPKDWSKSDVYMAYATYFGEHTSSKMDFNGSLNEKNMVNTVLNALSSSTEDYTFGNMTMVVSELQFSRARIGTITCYKKDKPNKKYNVVICSTKAECKKIIGEFYDQLEDLGYEAHFNIYSAVAKDILGQSVSSFTEKWLKKHLSKYLAQINQSGAGNLYNNLSTCHEYYKFIEKIRGGDMGAAGKLLEKIETLELDEQTAGDRIVKKAVKNLKKAFKELSKAYMQYMAGELKEDWLQKTWRAWFSCPVSISVWNENGDQLGYVGEDDIWYTDAIRIEEDGEAKVINSWTNEKLTFTISGTDYGILGCSIEEYDIGNEPKGRVNFYDIPLSEDTVLTLDMPDTLSERMVMRTLDGREIVSNEYIPVEDAGGVDITCVIEADTGTGGTVLGAGRYIRGDAAVLTAMPESGFRFGGWYRDDVLLTGSRVYEFTAKDDVNLKAKFYHEITIYVVTFDTQGHGTVPVADMELEAGSKVEEPPLPTADGYIFIGWYKEKSCETKWDFAVDTVQDDITLYAGWTENGAEKFYRVSFDTLNHGIAPEAYTDVKKNSRISAPEAPTADGYRFIG